MKLCKDCQHFRGANFCASPANGASPIDGSPRPMFATERRSTGLYGGPSKCGPGALHFIPKEVAVKEVAVKKPWWKFWAS